MWQAVAGLRFQLLAVKPVLSQISPTAKARGCEPSFIHEQLGSSKGEGSDSDEDGQWTQWSKAQLGEFAPHDAADRAEIHAPHRGLPELQGLQGQQLPGLGLVRTNRRSGELRVEPNVVLGRNETLQRVVTQRLEAWGFSAVQ